VFREINDGLVKSMKEKGCRNVNAFVGVSLKHIQDPRLVKEEKRVSYIDAELCTLCQECINLCPFDAVRMNQKIKM
jgi:NAD-dependent dihydropyrimidine dehydrogenase PreA subunit